MAKKRHYEQELQTRDSAMLSADMSAPANMPQDVKYHAWPKDAGYATSSYNDTISGVDAQGRADSAGAKRHKGGFKY